MVALVARGFNSAAKWSIGLMARGKEFTRNWHFFLSESMTQKVVKIVKCKDEIKKSLLFLERKRII